MQKRKFVSEPESAFSDPEHIIYHLLREDVKAFNKKRKNYLLAAIVCLPMVFVFLAIHIGLSILAFVVFLTMGYLYLTTKITRRINKIGLVNIPISHFRFQGKSILVDRTGTVNPAMFDYATLSAENIKKAAKAFDSIEERKNKFPIMLSPDEHTNIAGSSDQGRLEEIKLFKEEFGFVNSLQKVQEAYADKEEFNEEMPMLKKNNELLSYLKSNPGDSSAPEVEAISESALKSQIKKIDGIVEDYVDSANRQLDIDEMSINILQSIRRVVPRLDYIVQQSINETTGGAAYLYTNMLKNNMYNYYCPDCNNDGIKRLEEGKYFHEGNKDYRLKTLSNTKMQLVDIVHDVWKCPLCEEETTEPYGRHKLDDELFTPIYDHLYEENFKDRLAVFNDISNQKLQYSERAQTELEKVFRENRAKGEDSKSRIRAAMAHIRGSEQAILELKNTLVKYEKLKQENAREIENDAERIREQVAKDIEESIKVIVETTNAAQKDIDALTEKYANLERIDQKNRDAIQQEQMNQLKQSNQTNKKILDHTKKSREINEAFGERAGINKKSLWGLGSSERSRTAKKRM